MSQLTNYLDHNLVKAIEKKSVQFNEEVKVKVLEPEPVEINEEKIDKLLHLLHEADPTGERGDDEELLHLEGDYLTSNSLT